MLSIISLQVYILISQPLRPRFTLTSIQNYLYRHSGYCACFFKPPFLTLTLQRDYLLNVIEETTIWLSKTVKASLEHSTLTNDLVIVDQILRAEVGNGNMQTIRYDIDSSLDCLQDPIRCPLSFYLPSFSFHVHGRNL